MPSFIPLNKPNWIFLISSFLLIVTTTAIGQIALADIGVLYGSTGYQDGGRLITIDKISGEGTAIDFTGIDYGIPGIAINSTGEIFAVGANDGLYRLDADSANPTFINTISVDFFPAIAFNYKDVLYGMVMQYSNYYDKTDSNNKTAGYSYGGKWFLIEIDTSDASYTIVANLKYEEWRGMSFDPLDGNIYASTNEGDIYSINPINGESFYIGNVNLGDGVPDLAFDNDGDLYGSFVENDSGYIFASIDKHDASTDSIGNIGFDKVSGLASRTLPLSGAQIGASTGLDYGIVAVNSLSTKQLIIWNVGTENISISDITSPTSPFSMQSISFPLIIEPDSSSTIEITFSNNSEESFEREITIYSNDPDNPAIVVSLSATSVVPPTGLLFGSDGHQGIILAINHETAESDTVGFLEYGGDEISYVTEIEFAQDGTLFFSLGDGYSTLFKANVFNGEVEVVGHHDYGALPGLDFDANGTLYGSYYNYYSDSTWLVTIDLEDASFNYIGKTTYEKIRGLTFSPDGNYLYGVGPDSADGDTTDILMMIDVETGNAQKIGETGFQRVTALEFGPDSVLYGGLGDGGLIRINPETGQATFIGLTAAEPLSGLSFFPETPVITSIHHTNSDIPQNFSLYQNYPNPFNPKTKINFNLSKPGFVTLKVYNIIGQLVETLISEKMDSGLQSFDWNASNLASGLYFYKLQAGSQTLVKKAILLK